MLKMLKYEYRRGIFPLLIVFFVLAAIELYFVIATLMESSEHSTIALLLLSFAAVGCFLFVLIYGVVIYNQDLKNKSGYLVFMAPVSSYKIIGAKLLNILLTGLTLVVILILFGMLDWEIAADVYNFDNLFETVKMLFEAFGSSLTEILLGFAAYVVVILIQFYMVVTLAYFAISLSSTVLQSKKVKGVVSFLLFVVLYVIISFIADKLPTLTPLSGMHTESMLSLLYSDLPMIILYVICMLLCYIGSGALLDKKISL